MSAPANVPWVIFRLENQLFAISSTHVKVMFELAVITRAPGLPPHIRGLVNYNQQPIMVVDMRRQLGFQSLAAELETFLSLMEAREQDHREWLAALETCIWEGKPISCLKLQAML